MNKSFLLLIFSSLAFSGIASAVEPSTGTAQSRVPAEALKRRNQVDAWASKGDAANASSLITALGDKDYYTRVLAARGLGDLRWAAARARLEALLLEDPHAEVRESVAQALRQMPDPSSIPALEKALLDSSESVRIVATDVLGLTGSTRAVQALAGALKDQSISVRRTAAVGFQRLNDPAAMPALLSALKDPDVYVRSNAILAIGAITGRKTLPAGVKEALKDREPLVQAAAARTLAASGDISGLQNIKVLLQSSDPLVKLQAIEASGWSKDPEVKAQLKSLAADPDPGVRQGVTLALQRIQQRETHEKQ